MTIYHDILSVLCMLCCIYILQDKSNGSVSRLKEFLNVPAVQLQNIGEKLENAHVLTSSEYLKELEEKEKLKAEKELEAQKQLQKQQREEKRAQKARKGNKSETHGQDSTSEGLICKCMLFVFTKRKFSTCFQYSCQQCY